MIKNLLTYILFASGLLLNAQDFTAFIKAESGDDFVYLTFGFDPEATDDYDEDIDGEAQDVPDTGFDVALDWDGERYITQILEGDNNQVEHLFDIKLQFPEGENIVLTWDDTGLSDAGTFIIQDIFGGFLGVNVNMTLQNSVTITNSSSFTTLFLKVTPNSDATIDNRGPYAHALQG